MRDVRLILAMTCLVGCLDFDQFRPDTSSSSTGGSGGVPATGGGGNDGGAGATGAMGGAGGVVTEGGSGGGGAPPLGPCFAADPVSDNFDKGKELTWTEDPDVLFTNDQAELSFTPGNDATMTLERSGRLDNCYFQLELKKADTGFVYFYWRRNSNPGNEAFGFHVVDGVPHVIFLPSISDALLLDNTPLPQGFVRFGEEAGTYFVDTAIEATGPWTRRFETTTIPQWANADGKIIVGAQFGTGNQQAIVDNLNP